MLPLQGAQVRSLVGEVRSPKPCSTAKKKKKKDTGTVLQAKASANIKTGGGAGRGDRELIMVRLVCLQNSEPGKNGRSEEVGQEDGEAGILDFKCDGKEGSIIHPSRTDETPVGDPKLW